MYERTNSLSDKRLVEMQPISRLNVFNRVLNKI